jgi:hypothetical protein
MIIMYFEIPTGHFICKQYLILKINQWLDSAACGEHIQRCLSSVVLVVHLLVKTHVFATFFTTFYPTGHKAIVWLRKDNFWKSGNWIFKLGLRWDAWIIMPWNYVHSGMNDMHLTFNIVKCMSFIPLLI